MSVLVDTSALLALINRKDRFHPIASKQWDELLEAGEELAATNYVVLETISLLQKRAGIPAVLFFHEKILPVLSVYWINENTHRVAVASLLALGKRKLSLVDCASFEVMRTHGINTVFAFDRHFVEHGFKNFNSGKHRT